MSKEPVTVGDVVFPSKTALTKHIQAMMLRYSFGDTLPPDDFCFVCSLLERHPESARKVGVGVAAIDVRRNPEFGTKMLWATRIDGTGTDFSWKVCVDGHRPPTADATQAMREAVQFQVRAFKEQRLGSRCPYRDVVLTRENAHVDHVAPDTFAELVRRFLLSEGIALVDVKVTVPADGQVVSRLTDPVFEFRWITFHQEHANLRLLSAGANLSEARKRG